jgi:uncharacterized spore protein YtfJ
MDPKETLEQARDTLTVRRVFGEPIERDGVVVVPVASLRGAAGGGSGEGQAAGERGGGGRGGGWFANARPAGVYVLRGQEVSWQPAVDVNRIVLGCRVALIVGLLVLRSDPRGRRRRP